MNKKAVIIGASSGIGHALSKTLAHDNYTVGLVGRRFNLLTELQKELPGKPFVKKIDIAQPEKAIKLLNELICEMEGVDLIVISSGIGHINPDLSWPPEKETIEVNVSGFTAMVHVSMKHFYEKGSGHLVGISSLAALRGDGNNPAYNASKAYITNYLDGIRAKVIKAKLPIYVTNICPGFVDTAMAKGDGIFWMATPEKAAGQIYDAIVKKKKRAYITKRWGVIAWLVKFLPDFLYYKL